MASAEVPFLGEADLPVAPPTPGGVTLVCQLHSLIAHFHGCLGPTVSAAL